MLNLYVFYVFLILGYLLILGGLIFRYRKYSNKKLFCLSVFKEITNGDFREIGFLKPYPTGASMEGFFHGKKVNLAVGYHGDVVIGCYISRKGWRKWMWGSWKSTGVELNFKDKNNSVNMMSNAYERLIEKVDQELEY